MIGLSAINMKVQYILPWSATWSIMIMQKELANNKNNRHLYKERGKQ